MGPNDDFRRIVERRRRDPTVGRNSDLPTCLLHLSPRRRIFPAFQREQPCLGFETSGESS
jgi:hypothetical protein